MSEKRFVLCKKGDVEYIEDNCCVQLYGFDVLCEMLNEQQATINKLDQENADLLGARIKAQEEWEKCTDKLKEKILEQQATITTLKERLYDFEKRKIIEESEIDEDVIPKVKLLRAELFGEKYE